MLIKLTGVFDDEIANHPAKRVEGTKIDNGEKWDRKIFANAKELRGQLAEFGVGDTINVKMKKNGKYLNVVGFEKASEALIEAAKNNKGTGSNGGANRGTWSGRTGEAYDRSSAIYLAMDILKTNKALETKKADKVIDMSELVVTADMIFDYIHSGVNPFDKIEGSLDDIVNDLD